jgi:putative chitinase
MVKITEAQILRAVPDTDRQRVKLFVDTFNAWSEAFEITTPIRLVHFLAQVFHESGNLKHVEENLNYSADALRRVFPNYFKKPEDAAAYARKPVQIANKVYANRIGNGSEASGDGWRYRGRGLIGLTGKRQYADFNKCDIITEDVLKHPEKVADYPLCLMSALWFWEKYDLNDLADMDLGGSNGEHIVEKITKKVNGGLIGLAERKYYYRRFKREFGL